MTSNASPDRVNLSSLAKGKEGEYYEDSEWDDFVPHCIYFYYFTPKTGGYDNDYYFYDNGDQSPIDFSLLMTKIDDLVANASGGKNNPRPQSTKFGQDPWRRISWLVVAVKGNAFGSKKAVEIKYKKNGGEGKNHSFFDGGEKVVPLSGGGTAAVVWVHNHMRDAAGELLKRGQSQKFAFKFKSGRKAVFEIDESGTNTGPPVTPPPPPPPPPPVDLKGNEGADQT